MSNIIKMLLAKMKMRKKLEKRCSFRMVFYILCLIREHKHVQAVEFECQRDHSHRHQHKMTSGMSQATSFFTSSITITKI